MSCLLTYVAAGKRKAGQKSQTPRQLNRAPSAASAPARIIKRTMRIRNLPRRTGSLKRLRSRGEPEPYFPEDWPSYALPEGFPNTKVIDFRKYGNEIYIQWNIVSEEEVQKIVNALNEYLDVDHAWQGYFYSDGVKYKEGTEEEILNVEIRYDKSASGAVGENSDSQLVIEISGEGLPED